MIPFCLPTDREARDREDLTKLKEMLGWDPLNHVRFDCRDKAEIERVKRHLTEDELRRVQFTWLNFLDDSSLSLP